MFFLRIFTSYGPWFAQKKKPQKNPLNFLFAQYLENKLTDVTKFYIFIPVILFCQIFSQM